MTKLSTHAIRWGITLTALWAIAVLCSFTPPTASAHQRSSRVVVMEDAGAGNGPERAVQGLGGRVDREIPLINGFSARVPRSAVRALRGTPGVLSVHADRRFMLRSTDRRARHAEHHARHAARHRRRRHRRRRPASTSR